MWSGLSRYSHLLDCGVRTTRIRLSCNPSLPLAGFRFIVKRSHACVQPAGLKARPGFTEAWGGSRETPLLVLGLLVHECVLHAGVDGFADGSAGFEGSYRAVIVVAVVVPVELCMEGLWEDILLIHVVMFQEGFWILGVGCQLCDAHMSGSDLVPYNMMLCNPLHFEIPQTLHIGRRYMMIGDRRIAPQSVIVGRLVISDFSWVVTLEDRPSPHKRGVCLQKSLAEDKVAGPVFVREGLPSRLIGCVLRN